MAPLWTLALACAIERVDPSPAEPSVEELPSPTPVGDDDDPGPPVVPPEARTLVINEVVASNEALLVDADLDTPDWIELFNAGEDAVDLDGWTLTDDEDEPDRWRLPPGVLAPGEHLVVLASGKGRARPVVAWDTRIDLGDAWRYLAPDGPVDPDWMLPGFDDQSWEVGPSGFGRGDGDDATSIGTDAAFVRTTFELTAADLAEVESVVLHVDYDDGFVAWLNGREVARAHVGVPGQAPAWDTLAYSGHEAELPSGGSPGVFSLDHALGWLVSGENTLALSVHNATTTSSDLTLVPFLSLGYRSERPARASQVLDDLDRTRMHTNFQLRAEGEDLYLFDPNGALADEVDPGRLWADWSWGRQPDGSGNVGYFRTPTPGALNLTESRPGFAEPPGFDPPPGFTTGGTEVALVADPDATVRFAWGGVEPTDTSEVYLDPLPTGSATDAVVLRARAYQDGLWPSRTATATYILEDPGTLPIVSMVTDPPHLFDPNTGIDVHWWEDWERPLHLQLFEPDGTLAFAIDGKMEVHGGRSRDNAQRGYRFETSSGHGDPSIDHDVFPGLGITSFRTLLLRSAGNDWLGCDDDGCSEGAQLRDAVMHELTGGVDLDTMAYRPARAYLNGAYWGLYNLRERQDEHYLASHHGTEEVDLLERNSDIVLGDAEHYLATLDYLRTHDMADPTHYAWVKDRIDVAELQSYLAFQVYYANDDWPSNNIKYWRPRTPDGKWRWLLYDTDFGLGNWGKKYTRDTLSEALLEDGTGWPNPPWATELFRLLVESPEFRDGFANRYADHLNTVLRPEVATAVLDDLQAAIAPEIPRQLEQWGSWTDGDVTHAIPAGRWDAEIAWMHEWLVERPAYARRHVVENFGLAGEWALTLRADPPAAGTFELTAVTVTPPFRGRYFLGIPVTVTARPGPGYTFVGWSDPTLPATPTVTLDPAGNLQLVARFE